MGTRGAEIVRNIDAVQAELVIRKGYNREIDSYSAFREADRKTPTGLGGYLRGTRFPACLLCRTGTRFLCLLDGGGRGRGGVQDDRGK